mmetsp:Transcript_33985/g.64937  ORF Transcript_33985/g.64937 Transcript_33985/m.64937 type:complete len:188 (+) Transcript_33985:319-882(+)
MFSQLACEEAERPTEYDAHIVQPCSEVMLWTHVLKEVVDDLEWPGASVNVKIGRTPDRLGFEAQGVDVGKLEVDVDMAHHTYRAQILQCDEHGSSHRYKYKHLKIAMNITGGILQSQQGSTAPNTKLLVDANGLMKIHHMMKAASAPIGGAQEPRGSTCSVSAAAHFTLNPEDVVDCDRELPSNSRA